jgi:hypothetical protein
MYIPSMNATPSTRAWPVWVGLIVYTALRVVLLPTDAEVVAGFNHDSNYVAIVAGNLLAGRGYINDAHWLVFLQLDHLPVPYHNANPLYPTAVAGAMAVTGRDAVWCGMAVSAVSSSALFAALFVLARRYLSSLWQQAALAAAGTFLTPVFSVSLTMLPDALATALLAWCTVWLFGGSGLRATFLAGALLGLAWLTRSTALLAVPAVTVFLWRRDGWRLGLGHLAAFAVTAGLVALPWLIHTAVVWGDPLRTDSSYYLWQDYHAFKAGTTIDGYWHLPNKPRDIGEILRTAPRWPTGATIIGAPAFWSC